MTSVTRCTEPPPPSTCRHAVSRLKRRYTKGTPIRVVDFGDVNQNRTGVTLGCLHSGWVRIKLDPLPPSLDGDALRELLSSVVLYRFDAIRPLSMCPHPVCSADDVQRLGSAGLQLLTSTQEEALPRTTSPVLNSPHVGNRRTRDKSSRSPFHRQHSRDRSYFLGDGNGSPMSCSSRGIPIEGLSDGNLSDSDYNSDGDWTPGSGSEADMHDTAKLLFNAAIQHGGGAHSKDFGFLGSGIDESDDGGHAKRRSRTYGVFDRGTRVFVTDPKFVQEHGPGCKGTIVFFKGGGWYFLRMDMDKGAGGANGGVVMYRPSSFQVIEGRGEVSADDIALAEEKSGFTTVFPNGTRVSIISPNTKGQADDPTGKEGCVVDYKGGGWYFVKLDGVEAVTMSRKGSFVVLSLPPEGEPVAIAPKAELQSRRLKDGSSSGRLSSSHSNKSKLSPPKHLEDHASPPTLRPFTFGQTVLAGSGNLQSSANDHDSELDYGDGALGALLSIALGDDGSGTITPNAKAAPRSASSQSSHFSPTVSGHTSHNMSASSHDVSAAAALCSSYVPKLTLR
jgi:hypothetical protein